MNEPIYQYVKGEGWTLQPGMLTIECTLRCGTRVRLEHRKPNLGEYYDKVQKWNGRITSWINAASEPLLKHWANEFSESRLIDRYPFSVDTRYDDSDVFVTLVVIS